MLETTVANGIDFPQMTQIPGEVERVLGQISDNISFTRSDLAGDCQCGDDCGGVCVYQQLVPMRCASKFTRNEQKKRKKAGLLDECNCLYEGQENPCAYCERNGERNTAKPDVFETQKSVDKAQEEPNPDLPVVEGWRNNVKSKLVGGICWIFKQCVKFGWKHLRVLAAAGFAGLVAIVTKFMNAWFKTWWGNRQRLAGEERERNRLAAERAVVAEQEAVKQAAFAASVAAAEEHNNAIGRAVDQEVQEFEVHLNARTVDYNRPLHEAVDAEDAEGGIAIPAVGHPIHGVDLAPFVSFLVHTAKNKFPQSFWNVRSKMHSANESCCHAFLHGTITRLKEEGKLAFDIRASDITEAILTAVPMCFIPSEIEIRKRGFKHAPFTQGRLARTPVDVPEVQQQ